MFRFIIKPRNLTFWNLAGKDTIKQMSKQKVVVYQENLDVTDHLTVYIDFDF